MEENRFASIYLTELRINREYVSGNYTEESGGIKVV